MEILTALQWAKKGFIPNEEAKGTKQWTNSFYSAKAVYFKDSEVHEDKDTAKAILLAKRKEYRDVAKKRKEKRIKNAAYREKMKTQWQWLQEGRIPNDNARWEVGEELNKMFCTCAYGSNYCYCHIDETHIPKDSEEMQKAIFDFQQKELGMTINRVKKKFCSITNNDIDMSKKRTMQIDVIEEVKGTQFMQCKLYIDGNASVILMNKIDYERLLSDSFFVRDGKNRDSAGVLNTTNTFIEKD